MRNANSHELKLCQLQGSLFEQSPNLCNCSSPIFVRRFMNSDLASRFDDGSILFESTTPQSMTAELELQYGASTYGKKHYSADTLYWMGYLYRYWAIIWDISSKRIYKIIQARELSELFFPYHSLDPAQAIERIYEAKGMSTSTSAPSDGYIEKGVTLLRRMHAHPSYDYYSISI